jgi:NAD(P)-dependent dehydrogenase (short-subunit alcohol dehydrogenase family)
MEMVKTIRVFNGATAIVTGSASGIGRAIAEELARRGCEVILADRQIEVAEEVAAGIRSLGGKALATEVDVRDFSVIQQLVQETVQRTGRLDYIFNNAGITLTGNVSHYDIEDWNLILDVNLRGVINGIQAAYKVMENQGFGHIVNTSSMAGFFPIPGDVGYTTTKHAIFGLSKALRAEVAHRGIRVSVLCPGAVHTPAFERKGKYGKMLMNLSPEQQQRMVAMLMQSSKPIFPDTFAKKALDLVAKNKAIVMVPSTVNLFRLFECLFPSFTLSFIQKSFRTMQEQLGIE